MPEIGVRRTWASSAANRLTARLPRCALQATLRSQTRSIARRASIPDDAYQGDNPRW